MHKIFLPMTSLYLMLSLFAGSNKIVIQVSPPRCLSTASLRMWQARGDFNVWNEPFVCPFARNDKTIPKVWWREDGFKTFEEVEKRILERAQDGPLFIKAESYAIVMFFEKCPALLTDPRVHFVFLVRNPHHAILSLYRGLQEIDDAFSYFVGFKACYDVYKKARVYGVNQPIVLHAEALYTEPFDAAKRLCQALEVPFMETMLQWQSLGDSFTGVNEWQEVKVQKYTYHWHGDAIKSTGFHQPTSYELNDQGSPTFSEVKDKDRSEVIKAYKDNLTFYEQLIQDTKNGIHIEVQ